MIIQFEIILPLLRCGYQLILGSIEKLVYPLLLLKKSLQILSESIQEETIDLDIAFSNSVSLKDKFASVKFLTGLNFEASGEIGNAVGNILF